MTFPTTEIDLLHPALSRVVDCLMAYEPEQIILFGSRARGDGRESSDIDLVVVKETGASCEERFREAGEYLPKMLGVGVDVIVYTPQEVEQRIEARNPFLAVVFTEGVALYDRQPLAGRTPLQSRLKEPTMESRLRNGQTWLNSANYDLRVCRTLLTPDTASSACFHAQQAAEKALKGFLIFCGLPLNRTHSLQELVQLCVGQDQDLANCAADARALGGYYIDTRYAEEDNGFIFKTYELPESQRAATCAARVIALVESKIRPASQE